MSFLRSGLYLNFRPSTLHCRRKTTYIVLPPETPPDNAEDNVLLRNESMPKFAQLTPDKCWNGIGKLSLQYESGFWAMEEKLRNPTSLKTFKNVIDNLEILDVPLTTAWAAVKILFVTKNSEMTTEAYLKIHDRAKKARAHKFQSKSIFSACKEIKAKEENLTEAQHRVLDKYILEARLNGIELPTEKLQELWGVLQKLEDERKVFKDKVLRTTGFFSLQISNDKTVAEFPDSLLKDMAIDKENYKSGPWKATLDSQIYDEFMKYCSNGEMRESTWVAYNMRCSGKVSRDYSTNEHIGEIRSLRRHQAKLLGFENFAQMSMETKMAGNTDNVLSMITSLSVEAKRSQKEELSSLQIFAEKRGFQNKIEAYDVPYWRRRQKRELYNFSERQLCEYFPFEHVWTQLLMLSSQLFHISFEEIEPDPAIMWHPDVRLFNVLDSEGRVISQFLLDPYKRTGLKLYTNSESGWMLGLCNKSDAAQNSPISALIFNFNAPTNDQPMSLLSFTEVNVLFKRFGHALQHLLTTIPYGDAAGITNIEWDSVDVCAHLMQNWLYDSSVLESISQHHDSKLPLSESSIQDIISSRGHLAGYDLCNELYLSHIDLQMYTSKDYWFDVVKQLWGNYQPFDLKKNESHLCAFSPIFSDIWAAAYYSHTWSKMVSANVYQTFKEAKNEDELAEIGLRFRNSFLSLGGGCHPYEVFRKFCGRDPSPESLHDVLGIHSKAK